MANIKTLRTCKKGHRFYKSSDCRVCPVCEEERKSKNELFSSLAAPARRALENKGIHTLQELSQFSEKEVLQLHGIGRTAIPKLVQLLKTEGLKFTERRK